MNLSALYEELLAGKQVKILLGSAADLKTIYARLRIIKHRYDKKFKELTGSGISDNKVVRYRIASAENEIPIEVILYLGERKKKSSVEFTIITTTDIIENNCQENTNQSGEV